MITVDFVMNKFTEFKTELLTILKTEISTSITSALTAFRTEINQKFTDFKESHTKSTEEKISNIDKKQAEYETQMLDKITSLQSEIKDLRKMNETLVSRMVDSEDRGRKLNLVIGGLPADVNSTCQEIVERMFVNNLLIPSDVVRKFLYRNIHFLGQPRSGKSRSIIVAFVRQTDRDYVFQRANKLKGTEISLRPNYSEETRCIKDDLMKKRLELKSKGLNVRVVEVKYKPMLQKMGRNGRWEKYNPMDEDDDVVFQDAE